MNIVTIGSHYRRKFIEKEIPTSQNKFDCLDIDKVVVRTNDINDNGIRVTTKNQTKSQDLIKNYRPKDLKLV